MRLPADFVNPSPIEPNLASAVEAARAVQSALQRLASGARRFRDAVIALPDRAAHAALGEGGGSRAVRSLRAALVRGLTAGSGSEGWEADGRFRFGTLMSGTRRDRSVLGALAGTAVVRQYESAAEAAGLRVRWVDATSLAVLPEWLAAARNGAGERRLLLLHRRHFVLAAAAGQRLTGFRMRLRAPLDPEPAVLAVARAAGTASCPLEVWGDGAEAVAEGLDAAGFPVEPGPNSGVENGSGSPPVPTVVDRALAALLRRVGECPEPLRAQPVETPEGRS